MVESYTIHPVGVVRKKSDTAWIEIFSPYREAPRNNPANPLTGVFATHSPKRPNLIGLTCCRTTAIEEDRIMIDSIDARDGSPVIDIKGFIPDAQLPADVRVPGWVLPLK